MDFGTSADWLRRSLKRLTQVRHDRPLRPSAHDLGVNDDNPTHNIRRNFRLSTLSLASVRRLADRNQLRRAIPVVLVVVGAAILFYVGTQYWTMYSEQRRLSEEWQQEQLKIPTMDDKNPGQFRDGLTRMSIPKINLDAVVVEGTSHKALLRGPGHLTDTPAPGQPGNSVISAHRDTFFRHINDLAKGDLIDIQRNGRSYLYEVTGKKVVDPSDVSVLKQTADPQLTLITCYPTYFVGPAPERLVVFTKLSKDSHADLSASSDKPAANERLAGR